MSSPLISIIVVRCDEVPGDGVEEMVRHLASSKHRDRLEIVLVDLRCPAADEPLVAVHELTTTRRSVPGRRREGLRRARGEWIVFTEQFCRPGDHWVDAVIASLEPSLTRCAGPVDRERGSSLDWAWTFTEYGSFLAGAGPPSSGVPEINVWMRHDWLEAQLASEDEVTLIEVLPSIVGKDAQWVADAVIFDASAPRWRRGARVLVGFGREYGAWRRDREGRLRSIGRVLAAPAIPGLRTLRIVRGSLRAGRLGQLVRALPATLFLNSAWTVGECLGALGARSTSDGATR